MENIEVLKGISGCFSVSALLNISPPRWFEYLHTFSRLPCTIFTHHFWYAPVIIINTTIEASTLHRLNLTRGLSKIFSSIPESWGHERRL